MSTDSPTPALFTKIKLRGLTLPNRLVIAPMCQYSAVNGSAQDWHLMHLGQLAMSGAGMLILEATAVSPEGRITPGCLGLYSDENEAALRRVINALRQITKMPIAIQIGHAGRKASSGRPWERGQLIAPTDTERGGWQPVAPSAIAITEEEAPPRALTLAEIDQVVADFVRTTERAQRLGLDAIELHSAHGYLLHEFLSPIANHRTDEYGGSFENRIRLPLRVYDAVRAAWPAEKPLGVRISTTDWLENESGSASSGSAAFDSATTWTPSQSVELAKRLKAAACDWIDCSSGGVSPKQQIKVGPGYQVPFSSLIRRESGMTTMAVGLITEPQQANAIIEHGEADMVAMARGLLYNPRWPWHAAAALGASIEGPRQYWRCPPREAAHVLGQNAFGQR